MNLPKGAATSVALALLSVIGATSMSAAKTFVYVSNAQDGNIDGYTMDAGTGALIYDTDGAGGAAGVQFATVAPGLALTNADFLIV